MNTLLNKNNYINFLKRYREDEVSLTSAALAYYMFFSFFPVIIAASILFGKFAELDSIAIILQNIKNFLPPQIIEIIEDYLIFADSDGGSGILYISVFFTFYFPIRAVSKLMDGINRAYTRRIRRRGIKRIFSVIVFGVGIYLVIVTAIIMVVIGEGASIFITNLFNLPKWISELWNWSKFIVLWAVSTASVLLLHIFSVSERIPIKNMVHGCILSTTLWTVVSAGFSIYVQYIGRYSLLFGSLSAVIVLLYWLYMTSLILLCGAEFSSVFFCKRK